MVVYVDILLIVNFIIDYFLICLTAKLSSCDSRLWRRLLSAAVASLFSLYIFLPQSPFIIEVALRAIFSFVISLVAFGKRPIKQLLKISAIFFAVTFMFAGAMIFVWLLFEPNGMAINNSVVYFNVSPLFLIVFSVLGYFIAVLVRFLVERSSPKATSCTVEITALGNSIILDAIVDTGNSLSDVFSLSQIIICDMSAVRELLGCDLEKDSARKRYRAIPCGTVTGESLLDGYRCDTATIILDGGKTKLENPILAVSKVPLQDCRAIINPKSII